MKVLVGMMEVAPWARPLRVPFGHPFICLGETLQGPERTANERSSRIIPVFRSHRAEAETLTVH